MTGAIVSATVGVVGLGLTLSGAMSDSSAGGSHPNRDISQYDPFNQHRAAAGKQLMDTMANPSQVMSQPGYQQQLGSGIQAVNRGMAATGQLASGQEQNALMELGQNTFSNYYNNQINQLMAMSGAGQSPAYAASAMDNYELKNREMDINQRRYGQQNLMSGLGMLSGGLQSGYNWYKAGNAANATPNQGPRLADPSIVKVG